MSTTPPKPSLGRRDLKKQQTREALLTVTLRLAAERGLEHVTVEEICAEVGVSSRTFFNYFPAKDDAVLEDNAGAAEEMQRRLEELLTELPVLAAVHASLARIIAEMEAERERWLLRLAAIERSPSLLPRLIATSVKTGQQAAEIIGRHVGVPADGYPALVIGVAGAAFRAAMQRWAAGDGSRPLDAYVGEAFAALANGLADPRNK
ncbi:MAG: TetR family transcriptional regulator [Hamadaea sp.]|uniref:acyl-CoA-like ligand-binding transcription factor n=1 Tax=Hamadaea sp. TaxID=2024425 RepID=UPI0017B3A45D|nr:TetR family transcriptional regulator [Hamadaea sp.]NUR69378.1 TetR family transcriptional regulator [Hamadaea sp.]NUT23195.1 TetR family transcriptional regulator [Hamadaea sp.]